ncbi:NAD(P)/FAD-dependent oxidoreductase [Peribacillus sp. SCS-155]|uniref:NAD(P)/FAD-dependent oxidoreductase n=1 Tax=Peribacillus sedimenti TaxID=3115297 RepID=UPI003906AFF5
MEQREKAIIVGGGIAGKLFARVLSDFFKEVIILEKDQEPGGPVARKGAPQGEHLHALLHAGEYGLESLFPGINDRFVFGGAVKIDSTKDLAWFHHGVWKLRFGGEFTSTLQTRPHLEWQIEQLTKQIKNISYLYNHTVKDFLYSQEENRIYGVTIKGPDSSITDITGDIVVDASGVSSFSNRWLGQYGYTIPEEKVRIGLSYISKDYELPKEKRDWTIKLIYPSPPHDKIGGTISKVENDRYKVTLMGYGNEIKDKEVLASEHAFQELSAKLPRPDIFKELKIGKALSPATIYRVPHIIWRRFDKTKNLPKGLLLAGDTVCRIDPVFGQGMTIATLQALALKRQLEKQPGFFSDDTERIFQKKAAKIIKPVWNMVISEDFRYPFVKGKKPPGLGIQQWYTKQIFLLSSQNQNVYRRFITVMNLVKPAAVLFAPSVVYHVLKQGFRKKE